MVEKDIEVAAVNAPGICVVSGPGDSIERYIQQREEAGVETRRLRTSHAFHSQMMDPALPGFLEILKTITLNPPRLSVISNTTGQPLTDKTV